jgi:hypothetical protein
MRKLLIISLLLLLSDQNFPQWTLTNFAETTVMLSIDLNENVGAAGGWHFIEGNNILVNAYHTTDGGITWNNSYTPDSLRVITDIQMMNTNLVYGCGAINTSEKNDPDIYSIEKLISDPVNLNARRAFFKNGIYKGKFLQSTDGGQTWAFKGNFPDSVLYLIRISFTSVNTGYAIVINTNSNGIMKTTDGGNSWNNVFISPPDATLETISFIDEQHAIAGGSGIEFTLPCGFFAATSDGGLSWFSKCFIEDMSRITELRAVSVNKILLSYNNIDFSAGVGISFDNYLYCGIYYIPPTAYMDGVNGFTDGTIIAYGGHSPAAPFIKVSFNNGVNWTESTFPPISNVVMTDSKVKNSSEWFISGYHSNNGSLNGFLIHTTNSGGTPVEFSAFNVKAIEKSVVLEWTTSSEKNNSGFEVQKKSGSSDFITIGFVPGNGTTTENHFYSFIDDSRNLSGKIIYRLKQVDYDGSFSYSDEKEIVLTTPGEFTMEQNYPNPFNPKTTIRFHLPEKEMVTFRIYNVLGQEVYALINKDFNAGTNEIIFDASDVPSGVYFYELKGNGFNGIKKMNILK